MQQWRLTGQCSSWQTAQGPWAMPDAALYGDEGCDTLGNIARAMGGIHLPTLEKLGLGNTHDIRERGPSRSPWGFYGRMMEQSAGKDTTTGHWQICGLITEKAFPTYPKGFPESLMEDYEQAIGGWGRWGITLLQAPRSSPSSARNT